jgi:hypothetical protein
MLIQVNRDNQVDEREAPTELVEGIVEKRLGRILDRVSAIEVHVGHTKTSRTDNPEMRCSVEVRPLNLQPVAASAEGVGTEAVVRSACDKVLHAYDKVIGKQTARAGS